MHTSCRSGGVLALLAPLLLFLFPSSASAKYNLDKVTPMGPKSCEAYAPLYTAIDKDLALWPNGISLELMQQTAKQYTTRRVGGKGVFFGFHQGKAYILDPPRLGAWVGHHASLWLAYMRYMVHLENVFGKEIPDVSFVINTVDRPVLLSDPNNRETVHYPVMQFCRTDRAYAILIPIYHFHMKEFDNFIEAIPKVNQRYPWSERVSKMFGSYSVYHRYIHVNDVEAMRRGVNGTEICMLESRNTAMCDVRKHFIEWAQPYKNDIELHVYQDPVPMEDHANFKYLLHLDGQGLSSKFEQLLTLGSLVFREESGYRAFYYHLVKPYEHYIPFWKKSPDEVLDALQWARVNDEKALEIARRGQEFAKQYLNSHARACYWLTLLTRFSKLLNFSPSPALQANYMKYYKPVGEYLEEVMKPLENGRWWKSNFSA